MKSDLEIWLQFISNIFKYLTWPILILVITLIFKNSIKNLLKKLSKFSGKGLEFEFKSDLNTVTTELFDNESKNYTFHSKELEDMSKMTLDYPKASIIKAWSILEYRLMKDGERLHLQTGTAVPNINIYKLIGYYRDKKIYPESMINSINELRKLRNRAAHSHDSFMVTSEDAITYIKLVDYVIYTIDLNSDENS